MKSIYSVLALSIVFGCISCQKTQNQEIYFHKSHEESRKNAPDIFVPDVIYISEIENVFEIEKNCKIRIKENKGIHDGVFNW